MFQTALRLATWNTATGKVVETLHRRKIDVFCVSKVLQMTVYTLFLTLLFIIGYCARCVPGVAISPEIALTV